MRPLRALLVLTFLLVLAGCGESKVAPTSERWDPSLEIPDQADDVLVSNDAVEPAANVDLVKVDARGVGEELHLVLTYAAPIDLSAEGRWGVRMQVGRSTGGALDGTWTHEVGDGAGAYPFEVVGAGPGCTARITLPRDGGTQITLRFGSGCLPKAGPGARPWVRFSFLEAFAAVHVADDIVYTTDRLFSPRTTDDTARLYLSSLVAPSE